MSIIKSLFTISLASAFLSSCLVSNYPEGTASSAVTFGTYDTLPSTYVGDAYRYQNRYYYGGSYQRGSYNYRGRQYNDRYYHGGNYYYGGSHENHGHNTPQQSGNREHRSNDRGRGDGKKHDQH